MFASDYLLRGPVCLRLITCVLLIPLFPFAEFQVLESRKKERKKERKEGRKKRLRFLVYATLAFVCRSLSAEGVLSLAQLVFCSIVCPCTLQKIGLTSYVCLLKHSINQSTNTRDQLYANGQTNPGLKYRKLLVNNYEVTQPMVDLPPHTHTLRLAGRCAHQGEPSGRQEPKILSTSITHKWWGGSGIKQ